MKSSKYVSLSMPPNEECRQQGEVLSGESVYEQDCDNIHTNKGGEVIAENCEDRVEEPMEGMTFDTSESAYLYYAKYAKEKGFSIHKRTSRKGKDGKLQSVALACSRDGTAKVNTSNPVNPRPQSRIGCPARITVVMMLDGKWRLNLVTLEHNHEMSPSQSRFFKSNRVLNEQVKRRLELNDEAGIRTFKTYDSLQIEAGGPDKLPFLKKDCTNYLDKQRRLRLVEGDADAMYSYFMKMKDDNPEFYFAMDLDGDDRLKNVFWADARSRAAFKEFGDVVTFDTTYLVNKWNMPFAPFVGVNHHGHSTLLGCGLISNEDTESFLWLFKTWMRCMKGCAPKAIITDQCVAMKNAIEEAFPNTRHRWCIWHIMKKLPDKFGSYEAYKNISWSMRVAVYDSLTIEEFEDAWDGFIKKYELQSNTWLEGLYLERRRWVPAYVKDAFWAGMSSTQRSEGINAYFDGYINAKTTLKQFVEQYEHALMAKVEKERHEDAKSSSTFIPLISECDVEEQFQSAYTNAKFKEIHKQLVGKMNCLCSKTKAGDIMSEFEVKQWLTFGEGEQKFKKQVSFIVNFNAETNETHCNCRLFEFRGIVCTHQLMAWHEMGIQRVPNKYVLRRWSKNVKRVHTKVRICYDKSSRSIEAHRHDKMCEQLHEIADLADGSQEKYDMVMSWTREIKQKLLEASVVVQNNAVSHADDTGTKRHESGKGTLVSHGDDAETQWQECLPLGDGDKISSREEPPLSPSKCNMHILDPVGVRRKGRPRTKRKISLVDKVIAKKRQAKKKPLSNEEPKGINEIAMGQHISTEESVVKLNDHPSCMGHSMWPNMMPHDMPFPFSQPLLPTGISSNKFNSCPSSQSLYNAQVWMGQSALWGSQVLGGGQPIQVYGGESSSQVLGGQPSQVLGWGQPSQDVGQEQPSQVWGGGSSLT